jgi:hypothetical protein
VHLLILELLVIAAGGQLVDKVAQLLFLLFNEDIVSLHIVVFIQVNYSL